MKTIKPYSMKLREAAHYIGVSVSQLRKLARSGVIDFCKRGDFGHIYFRTTDLERYINKGVQQ